MASPRPAELPELRGDDAVLPVLVSDQLQLEEFGDVVDEGEGHGEGEEVLLGLELPERVAHRVVALHRHAQSQEHRAHTAHVC